MKIRRSIGHPTRRCASPPHGLDGSVLGRVNQDTPDYLSPGGFMKVAGPAARAVASSRGAAALAPPTR